MSTAREGPDSGAPAVSRRLRAAGLVAWAVLAAHLVATVLWTAPGRLTGHDEPLSDQPVTTPAHRVLRAWMTPVFDQGWSLFAPEPLHVDYVLRVRGVWASGPGGALEPGPWTDATAVETRALMGHVLPAATERPARRLAAEVRAAYLALPDDARVLALGSTGGSRADLTDAGAPAAVVDRYLAADRALTAYATQVVSAERAAPDDGDPVYVQAAVVRREVAPPGAPAPPPDELTLGARAPLRLPGQDDAAFAATWARLGGRAP
ncbi:DUF5819 family protein [Promicromonospora thailandica]|uniref:DUF5819 family protein n=1 Tax=Promicromonospora thailandica TaxID=765201 RepID=UPI0020A41B8B|nr:DUF5819 family protein [Promicromonospora thailandica]